MQQTSQCNLRTTKEENKRLRAIRKTTWPFLAPVGLLVMRIGVQSHSLYFISDTQAMFRRPEPIM